MSKNRFWAGFSNGCISETLEHYGDQDRVLSIYIRKKDAKKHYQDVRPVEIKEIKK